jgi:hypothetical protein
MKLGAKMGAFLGWKLVLLAILSVCGGGCRYRVAHDRKQGPEGPRTLRAVPGFGRRAQPALGE